jgi:hypothetical protein
MIIIFAYGTMTNLGTIQCVGGGAYRGGGGGGGHIHFAAHDTVANIEAACSVSGGSSSLGGNGGTGTINAIDLDSDPYGVLGSENGEAYRGWLMELIEGVLI